jgi:hypothetical protein
MEAGFIPIKVLDISTDMSGIVRVYNTRNIPFAGNKERYLSFV